MAVDLQAMVERARTASGPSITADIGIGPGGVDPLGLRQINFGLMDRVLQRGRALGRAFASRIFLFASSKPGSWRSTPTGASTEVF